MTTDKSRTNKPASPDPCPLAARASPKKQRVLFYQLTSSASRLAFGIGSDPYLGTVSRYSPCTPALSVLCCGVGRP